MSHPFRDQSCPYFPSILSLFLPVYSSRRATTRERRRGGDAPLDREKHRRLFWLVVVYGVNLLIITLFQAFSGLSA